MREGLKEYIFELQEMLDALVERVAGKIEQHYCEEALSGCAKAAKLCKHPWEEPIDAIKKLEGVLSPLIPVVDLLYDHPEIHSSEDITTQQAYEACMCLLTRIDTLGSAYRFGFKNLGGMERSIIHPLVDGVFEGLSRIFDQCLTKLEDSKQTRLFAMIGVSRQLDTLKSVIEEITVETLNDFSMEGEVANALQSKHKTVSQLVDQLKPLGPKALEAIKDKIEEQPIRKKGELISRIELMAEEMTEISKILMAHAGEDETRERILREFDYSNILPQKAAPDPMARIRHDMLAASAQMAEIVPATRDQEEKEVWDIALFGLESAAVQRNFGPNQISPFVELAMDVLAEQIGTAPKLLSKLSEIHQQLERQPKKP